MPRQIEDDEYAFLQSRRQVADFVESIYNDPTLSKEAKALVKKKYPNLNIPDYDIEERIEKRLNDDRKEREDRDNKQKETADTERFSKLRKDTQSRYGFTDEGMEKLERFMVEKNVGDYDVAAGYLASKEPKQSEANFDTFRWNHHKQDGFKEIAEDPEAWGRSQILKAINADQERERGGR